MNRGDDDFVMAGTDRGAVAPVLPTVGGRRPLGLDEVHLVGGFWGERQERNASVTIDHCDRWEQRVGWIDNFTAAADGTVAERRSGPEFADSDVYKLIEAMAWEVARTGNRRLDARIEELAGRIEAAQEPDGYLNTGYGRPGQRERYSDLAWGHELYCYGHLIQAAVARLRAGRKDTLVRVALRVADHVCAAFGPGGIESVCGHPEIELALAELYRVTGTRRYLDQARLFVQRRGTGTLPEIEFGRAYYQDDIPVRDAQVLRGHAVRALYLASGTVDVAVETGDTELLQAVIRQYDRTLARRTYITGGMGSHHQDEAFGEDFELPPDRSYCETCAAIASVMLSWRLLLATGRTEYADVIERTLYNAVAVSPSRQGNAFFYANTLHKRVPGAEADPDELSPRASAQLRAPWFHVACCPNNVARTMASLAGYVATADGDSLQVHQLVSCDIRTTLPAGEVALAVRSALPDAGQVVITVTESVDGPWELVVRIPAWARGGAMLDGHAVDGPVARVHRVFTAGDEIKLELPVSARITTADPRIDAVRGCVAVERGPLVLCLESPDLPDGMDVEDVELDLSSPPEERDGTTLARFGPVSHTGALWPYTADGAPPLASGPGRAGAADDSFTAPLIPYHAWANRGPSTMRVWLPVRRPAASG
jgi:DUF1680 family protein